MKAKILVLLFTLLTNITILSQPLSIEIKLDTEEYLIYEPIMLIIRSITNQVIQLLISSIMRVILN